MPASMAHRAAQRTGRRPRPEISRRRDCYSAAPPLPLVGVSIWVWRGCQQNGSLIDGYLEGLAEPHGRSDVAGLLPRRVHHLAVGGETAILPHPPLPLAGVNNTDGEGVSAK